LFEQQQAGKQLITAMPAAAARIAGIRFPANPREENKIFPHTISFTQADELGC
jgi:hypothetical protein